LQGVRDAAAGAADAMAFEDFIGHARQLLGLALDLGNALIVG
jgi:hypothetical protein